ncbi:MAG TPA: pentapeptide repeat-containing protein [Syntrophales bacterium]|nr:pentapeptide repeat-containing protein [Syntrophales bacterium]
MPCCYEDGNGWCKHLETVYKHAGKEYCVFHAPQGKKGILLDAFNELVFARIREAQEKKKTCDLSGTIFEGNIAFNQFDKNNPLPSMECFKAYFNGFAVFQGTHFGGNVDFRETRFRQDANFMLAQFSMNATFIGARFRRFTVFMQTLFCEGAYFSRAQFSATNFERARFNGHAYFVKTQFSGEGNFQNALFRKEARFEDTCFRSLVSFMNAHFNNANFNNARFNKEGGFMDAQFNGYSSFAFLNVMKKGQIIFQDFAGTNTFLNQARFWYLNIEGSLLFEGTDLSEVSFSDTQIQKIDFVNVKWPRSGLRSWRNVLYDEIDLFEQMKKNNLTPNDDRLKTLYTDYLDFKNWIKRTVSYGKKYGDQIRKVGILYRRMKNKYRTLQNWSEVSNWHYGEKEMYRKENAFRRYLPSFSFLYWLSSGYGERYVRAGVVLAALIFLLSFGLAWTGLDAAGVSGLNPTDFHGITSITLGALDLKSIGALLMNTLKYATFQKDVLFVPRNMWGELIRLIAQILIPIQTALFILAVRNRFRR